jgi:hypothetical protein
MATPTLTKLAVPERKRTYLFPGGETVTIDNVIAVGVRSSGTHRVEAADGMKWIIPPGWLAICLDMDAWTF